MPLYAEFALVYFALISLVAVAVTIKDKRAAFKGKRRIPEATLMLIGLCGGATAMLITMKIIRHKTKHLKFMVGLPLETALHAALVCAIAWLRLN